jgi:HEAT repeat protein
VTAGILARLDHSRADAVLPVLLRALGEGTKREKAFATYCLGLLGSISTSAVPALMGLLKDDNVVVVCNAARTLGRIGSVASVPVLIELLGENEVGCATDAAIALGEIGSAAYVAIPSLQECLQRNGDCFVRELRLAAAEAMWRVSGDPGHAVAVAKDMLTDEEEWLVFNACHILGELGTAARPRPAPAWSIWKTFPTKSSGSSMTNSSGWERTPKTTATTRPLLNLAQKAT